MKASPRVGIGRMTKEMFNARCATNSHTLDTFKQVFQTAQYKIDGFGARFGFDEEGKFFFETSKSGILYDSAEIVTYTANNYKNEPKEKFERGMKRAVVYADLMDTLKNAVISWQDECKGERVFIEVLARDLDEEEADSPTSTFVKSQYSKEIFIKDEEKFLLFFHTNGAPENHLFNVLKTYPTIFLSPSLVFIENRVNFGIQEGRFAPDRFDLDNSNITPWDILLSRLAMTMFDNCFAKEGIIFYLDDTPYKILSQDWNKTSPLPDDVYSFNILYPGKFAPLHRGHIEDVIAYEKNIESMSKFVPKFVPCIIGNHFNQNARAEWMKFLIDNLSCTSTFKNFTSPLFSDDGYLPDIIKKFQRENHHAILGVVCGQDRLRDYERMIKEMPMPARAVDCINKNITRKYSGTEVRRVIRENNYAAFVDMVFPEETGGRSNATNPDAFKMFKSLKKSLDNK